jgi:hypothetical protein
MGVLNFGAETAIFILWARGLGVREHGVNGVEIIIKVVEKSEWISTLHHYKGVT